MTTMNRLGNIKNPYQTHAKRVLVLCSAGLLRSPTVANVLYQEYGYNTRAAGVSQEYALIPVDEVLLHWADEIVFVDPYVRAGMSDYLNGKLSTMRKTTRTLNIPDEYEWNSPEIVKLVREQYSCDDRAECLSKRDKYTVGEYAKLVFTPRTERTTNCE